MAVNGRIVALVSLLLCLRLGLRAGLGLPIRP